MGACRTAHNLCHSLLQVALPSPAQTQYCCELYVSQEIWCQYTGCCCVVPPRPHNKACSVQREGASMRSIRPSACPAHNQVVEEYPASVVMVGDVALNEVNLETSASLPKLLYAPTGYVLSALCTQLTLGASCHVQFIT